MQRSTNDIENILNSLNGLKRAEAKPFMHTRVMARLNSDEIGFWSQVGFFIARPIVAFCCLLAIIAVNYFVINSDKQQQEAATGTVNSASDIVQGNNFILAMNSYDSNTEK